GVSRGRTLALSGAKRARQDDLTAPIALQDGGVPADRKQHARSAILACSQAWVARFAPQASYRTAIADGVSLDLTAMGSLRVELGNNGPHWLMSGGPLARVWPDLRSGTADPALTRKY